ncbi:MAG: hypothetical protein K9K37_03710 [Desulfocapsa sp.]|nr:hypothetical protein [Desulfocapsa sp.]
MLDDTTIKKIYAAQTLNVKALDKAWAHQKRTINQLIVKNDKVGIDIHTKLLALSYSAYAESLFIKLIHTPDAFKTDEISQVKQKGRKNIVEGWKKCLELALQKVGATERSSHVPNVRKRILDLINTYVLDPSLIRNKIAHGQWIQALNNKMTDINTNTSAKIKKLDPIKLEVNRFAFTGLYRIVEDIVKSPNKAHMRDYWVTLSDIEQKLSETKHWCIEDREQMLLRKRQRKT